MSSRRSAVNTTGRTQDDTGILDTEMLKFASVRVPLAVSFGLAPVLISSVLYVSTFSFITQIIVGVFAGLIGMFVFQLFETHRSTVRRQKTLQIAQMSELTHDDVGRLLPEPKSFPDWVSITEFGKVEWLNKQMDIIWPFLDKAISDMLKAQLQPTLNQYASGVIQKFTLQNLTLGRKAPRFDGIKVSAGQEDETVLETMFQWTPESENLVLKIEVTGPDFKVKVTDIHVSGTLIFIMKPLLEQVPPFGAVLVSFTEAPDVDFNLKFLGGSIDAVPGVEKFIDDAIRTALIDSMVWPCRIVVPVAPGDWSYLELHPIAELDFTLIEVQDVMKTDIVGKSDPFCIFYVRQKNDKTKRSSTKKNKKSATWNEDFTLEVEDRDLQKLTVRLMDDESLEKAQYVGSAEYKISNLKPGVAEDIWLDMVENPHSSSPQQPRGRVHLMITYKPLSDADPSREAVNKAQHDATVPNPEKESPKKESPEEVPTSSPPLADEPHS
ncbi:unnamed protein product [Calypogeia fissa]